MGKNQEKVFMSQLFKLIDKEFSPVFQEWQWTYRWLSPFSFNNRTIECLTITDHYQIEHKEVIINELILEILVNLPPRMNPKTKHRQREIFVWEHIPNENQEYRLVFWYDDNNSNALWIKNCYPID